MSESNSREPPILNFGSASANPYALEIDTEGRHEGAGDSSKPLEHHEPSPHKLTTPIDTDLGTSRSTSVSSSLDAYYFGAQSPSDSPHPPVPTLPRVTPDHRGRNEPMTPARDPAAIDRRGLHGLGELATPRWTRNGESKEDLDRIPDVQEEDESEEVDQLEQSPIDQEPDDHPDSPWTIEAVDGEFSDRDELAELPEPSRTLRTKRSIADESGGEEILYPRTTMSTLTATAPVGVPSERAAHSESDSSAPPNSLSPPTRRNKKRTSDEFEMDQTGGLLSKHRPSTAPIDATPRKHHSTSGSIGSARDSKVKERRRDSVGQVTSPNIKIPAKHGRQLSSGSSSSHTDPNQNNRRAHTSDYSHLPPSPSTNSIQQFLRSSNTGTTPSTPPMTPGKELATSPNVAHSLLRGTQEGWDGLDDSATAEALRKLDGIGGKHARVRSSIGSTGRPSSSSRPGSSSGRSLATRESIGGDMGRLNKRSSAKDLTDPMSAPVRFTNAEHAEGSALSSDDLLSSGQEKLPKKTGTASARSSLVAKRGSASSTSYTGTPSSRDSATISAGTSMTSISAVSHRHSMNRHRRNSAGSDGSSVHSGDTTSLKDRAASLASNGDGTDDQFVPPVPPLPKNLDTYKSPPSTAVQAASLQNADASASTPSSISLEVTGPGSDVDVKEINPVGQAPPVDLQPPMPKTPSKKWSFTNALKLSSSPSGHVGSNAKSPRAVTFGQQIRKSLSREHGLSPGSIAPPKSPWSPMNLNQPNAMESHASLTSLSSVGSAHTPAIHTSSSSSKTPERHGIPSRTGTDSSASVNTTSGLTVQGPLSPSSSVRRGQSKRLTPSSIPFFRRSSSQSMHVSATSIPGVSSSSPPSVPTPRSKQQPSPGFESNPPSTSTHSTHRKSSGMGFGMGIQSLLKGSSSRKSLHSDSKEALRDLQKAKDATKELDRQKSREKEKLRKEDKEGKVSTILGRKRGKTLSSAEPRKPKSPVNMPPLQISALEPATAQRVARLKSTTQSSPTTSSPTSTSSRGTSNSRVTSQTVSSMQKHSDSSLRSNKNQLPTIAGSPSVIGGSNGGPSVREGRDGPPIANLNNASGSIKETPTKIPRISSRSSTTASPNLKGSTSTLTNRRASGIATSRNTSPTTNEFGLMDNGVQASASTKPRMSPPLTASRMPRHPSSSTISSGSILPRSSNRESISFAGLRKASTSSVHSTTNALLASETSTSHSHRFSALSPSKGLKLLSPKISLSATRSNTVHRSAVSPSVSRQSLSTPSPVPSSIDDEEMQGDEEMMLYIKRQQAKKLASGSTQEQLDELLRFPEPLPPGTPSSPAAVLKSSQSQYLSDYERQEILDYPQVYHIGAKSKKKRASPDVSTNNFGYDDERGDYLVIPHDHLAYRYEIIDTLGKGSFGQVIQCRDHNTGESLAVKIIRNKKRFHHQALVEIKILDNLRKWDPEEKHHVIMMTEHFYFRNHLCIAMELLSINLYELIKANSFVGFTTALIRRFTSQMLMSLSLMRHHRIVHCDLKPENVLLRHPAKSAIKVIDFGSSCLEHEKIYTYIQSRFYRSPEVILGMNYHMAIDMWSLGCILAELFTGFPIFPGENEQEQLSCIMEVLGPPDKEFINKSSRKKLFFESNGAPRAVVNSKGRRRRPGTKTLSQVLKCTDEEFLDFISKCLVWDPERRIKPQAALRHPFITANKKQRLPALSSRSTLSSVSLTPGRRKDAAVAETPKKSLISAPTPLTARSSRSTATTGTTPQTPSGSSQPSLIGSSSRSYRLSSSYQASRTGTTGYNSSK